MARVQPNVVLIEHTPNPDKLIALSAKLCYSDSDIENLKSNVEAKEQDKFISKLMEMSHLSPIEHASFTFGIEGVSRALLAQITRHRVASFSVKSQRYVGANEDFDYILPKSIEELGEKSIVEYDEQMKTMGVWYKKWQTILGGKGESSNEDARFVLPNASETKMLVTMNARELLHFFELRCCNRAQWEIREVAWLMLALCKKIAPSIFKNAGASCLNGRCSEGAKACGKASEIKERSEKLNK